MIVYAYSRPTLFVKAQHLQTHPQYLSML